jgi:hypothetical protein
MTLPKDVRELARFGSDAINAHMRGMSVPAVALRYRYEPITAIVMLRNLCSWYGEKNVELIIPAHIYSFVMGHPEKICAYKSETDP